MDGRTQALALTLTIDVDTVGASAVALHSRVSVSVGKLVTKTDQLITPTAGFVGPRADRSEVDRFSDLNSRC